MFALSRASRFIGSGSRQLSNLSNLSASTANEVFQRSCYHKIDFRINEDTSVKEAIKRFTAFHIGCLAVTDKENKIVGVCSERDFITKVASLDKNPTDVKVKEICTYGPNTIIARKTDSLENCMNKMMLKDIRHLLIVDDKNEEFIGMISIKDLIKEILNDRNETITRLTDLHKGKGAFFGSD